MALESLENGARYKVHGTRKNTKTMDRPAFVAEATSAE